MFTIPSRDDNHSQSDKQVVLPGIPARADAQDRVELSYLNFGNPSKWTFQTNRTALRTISHAAQFAYGYALHAKIDSSSVLDGLEALRQAAQKSVQRELHFGSLTPNTLEQPTPAIQFKFVELNHAEPLAPLKERDVKALETWFQQQNMDKILSDIFNSLHQLVPEPCWEDDPFDFLREFL